MGVIYSIVYQPIESEDRSRSPEFLRICAQQVNLIAGHGIEGDRKAGHHPKRQINLLSREWLLRLQDAQLQLGPTACIEITQGRKPCGRLAVAQQSAVAGLKTIGLMATVVVGGTIRVGDAAIVRSVTQYANSRQNQVPANTGKLT